MKQRDLRAIMLAIGLATASCSLNGCSKEENEIFFNEVLDDVSDNTCVDEILESEEHSYLLKEFYTLEKYLTFSETLHELNLEEKIDNLTEEKNNKENSIDEIETSIKEFKELEEFKDDSELNGKYNKKLQELIYIEGSINQWIKEKGYRTIYSIGKLITKSKLVDIEDLDINEYINFVICKNPNTNSNNEPENITITYINEEKNKKYNLELDNTSIFGGDSMLLNVVNDVYNSEKTMKNIKTEKNKYNLEVYNEDRNIKLREMIENIKLVMYSTYEEKDHRVYQLEFNSKIKEKYNAKKEYIRN